MNHVDDLLQRNKEFAVRQSAEGTLMPSLPRAMPGARAIIIGCADMRVDPLTSLERTGRGCRAAQHRRSNHPGVVGAVGSARANR